MENLSRCISDIFIFQIEFPLRFYSGCVVFQSLTIQSGRHNALVTLSIAVTMEMESHTFITLATNT